jgi:glycosyltransferase involved in cell wall biosynthesis
MMPENTSPILPVLFGYHASNLGNSHVALSLCRYWQASGKAVQLTVPSADSHLLAPWLKVVMGKVKRNIVYRLASESKPRELTEKSFLKNVPGSSAAFLWAGLSLDIFRKIKDLDIPVIVERINCHQATARRILAPAYDAWNIPWNDPISDERITEENEKLSIADSIFCPSPMVEKSMIENGISKGKLISTSYGWAPERFTMPSSSSTGNSRPVFLFVGTLCLRKGIPLLLEAWRKADIDGELLLCGGIAPEIKNCCDLSKIKNVRHIPYTRDVGSLYKKADVFVCPTLEEGGPMVTYEAMAHGNVPLVTHMGAGAIARDGIEAILLSDNDPDAWAEAITDIAINPDRRHRIGEAARIRAREFTWNQVAMRRAALLEERYPSLWNNSPSL